MTTTALAPQTKPCTNWCGNHDHHGNICFTDDIVLNFPSASPWEIQQLSVGLAAETDGRVVVQLGINGVGPEELTPESAIKFARALLAMGYAGLRGGAR